MANYQSAFAGGTFAFDQAFTRANYLTADSLSGKPIASMLLGAATSGGVDYIASPYYSWRYCAPWVQDDIKVTRRLTVNLGLRWDILGPLTERYNRLNYGFFPSQLNPISSQINQTQFPGYKAYGGIGFTGVGGLPRTAFNTDWNNVQPRVGAAFQLTPTTVLRGGFGISYIPQVSFGDSYGFSQSTPYVASRRCQPDSCRYGFQSVPQRTAALPPDRRRACRRCSASRRISPTPADASATCTATLSEFRSNWATR